MVADTGRSENRGRAYFSESEIITNSTGERNRITKSVFLYAYFLNPNHRVIRINMSDGHVEQSPESLPTKIYAWSRVFVVNLTGLEPGAVVTYAMQFRDRARDTLWMVKRLGRIRLTPPIARDMEILSRDKETFRLGVWTEAGCGFSNRKNWGELYGQMRESIYTRIPALESPIRQTVEVTLATEKPVRRPNFKNLNFNGIVFQLAVLGPETVRMKIELPAGELKNSDRDSPQAGLCRY